MVNQLLDRHYGLASLGVVRTPGASRGGPARSGLAAEDVERAVGLAERAGAQDAPERSPTVPSSA
jgi:hypothetical protein